MESKNELSNTVYNLKKNYKIDCTKEIKIFLGENIVRKAWIKINLPNYYIRTTNFIENLTKKIKKDLQKGKVNDLDLFIKFVNGAIVELSLNNYGAIRWVTDDGEN